MVIVEELYIDYGSKYDRNDYGGESLLNDQTNLNNDIESARLQAKRIKPVLMDEDESDFSGQDNTLPGGFLDKLKKQDKDMNKPGILRPDEAAKTFAEYGSDMFLGNEDKELIESLTGKPMIPLKEQPNRAKGKVSGDKRVFSDLLDDKSSGRSSDDDDDDEKIVWEDKLSESATIFGDLSKPAPKPVIKESVSPPPDIKTATKPKQTYLTPEEAMNIANRLDDMSEEQLRVMANQMRSVLQGAMAERFTEDIKNSVKKGDGKIDKPLPPTKPMNKEVREKYDKEFKEIEKELEKIYQNPETFLKDLFDNPEKYMDDDMLKELKKM